MQLGESPRQEDRYGKIIVAQVVDSSMRWIGRRSFGLMQHVKLARIVALVSNERSHLSNDCHRKPRRRTDLALCCHYSLDFADLRFSIVQAKVLEPVDG
jgi:hypothetical protein